MTPTLLQTVLRRAARLTDDPTAPGASDADLLRRFAERHDEAAFQTLLGRHGPLVWAVCRQMLADPTDAEDAFQATFLALVQSAGKLGRVKSVGGWLHGVAVKVCLKVRRSAVRRKAREQRSAKPEAAPVEPRWDDLHAAVHEEVERLPATLRSVFVLCELEGVRQPDAAAQLGCKLGTLSARLTRARQALLKALTARGLAPTLAVGTVAVGSSRADVPLVLVEKAILLARGATDAGLAVPSGVIQLARSVTEGTMMKTKLLVAAGFAAAGVMLTAAGGWADAQSQPPARGATRPAPRPPEPPKPPRLDNEDRPAAPLLPEPPAPPRPPRAPQPPRFDDETRPLEPPLGRSRFEGPQPIPPGPGEPPPLTRGPQQRVEHLIRAAAGNQDELIKLINDEQANGWEFAGETHVGKVAMLVFKRPKGNPLGERPGRGREPFGPDSRPIPSQEGRFAPTRPAPQPPAPRGDRFPMSSNPSSTQPPMAPGLGDALPPRDLYTPSPINSGPPPMMPMSQPALMPQPTAMIPPARRADVAEISVLELKHAQPAAMSQHVKAFFPDVTVAVDEATGSLVIRCDKPTLDAIKALTEKLDKPAKAGGNFSAVPS